MATVPVAGMSCSGCVESVARALRRVPGVREVHVSLERGEAEVEGEAPREDLVRAVEAAGYEVPDPR
jgi:copper chaperone CopZ